MKCQAYFEADDRAVSFCELRVELYSQCGVGCNKEIAYCKLHGGYERCKAEMIEHHREHEGCEEKRR